MDLYAELRALLADLEATGEPYALAGGMALAVHGVVRATIDLDLLVLRENVDAIEKLVRRRGFDVGTRLAFAGGLEILRWSKIEGEEVLSVDLLLVHSGLAEVWAGRERRSFGDLEIAVVSRAGLTAMKLAAGREQDLADVARLRELDA